MDIADQLNALIELAESLKIPVRRVPLGGDSADHPGGAMVRLKGEAVLFLDSAAAPEDQLAAVAAALRGREELRDRFLLPEIRRLLDSAPPAE